MNPSHIRTLNITCLYWIPANELRKLIRKMENLQELIAIDTKLGLRENDIMEYLKLRKLAVSVEDDHFGHGTVAASKHLKALKSLYLKIILKKEDHREVSGMRLFFCNIKHLEELWILDDHESLYRINYERLVVELKNLKKFVVRSKSVVPIYDFTFVGLSKVFECRRCSSEVELIFERILNRRPTSKHSIFEPKKNDLEKAWEVFENLHADLPCGPVEYKLLNLNHEVTKINFEDLNFCHTVLLCNSKYVDAALQILQSENSKGLKRLNFRSCLFQNFLSPPSKENTGFKRVRYGVKTGLVDHPFEKVARNLKKLREIEIFTCRECSGNGVISGYPLIGIFENLQKLTLEIPLLLDGAFLKEVFMKCQKIEWLSLKCIAQNEKFMINLCQNLKYSAALKHLRLEHNEIVIDKLLTSLTQIDKKLLRIFLECENLRFTYAEIEPFTFFMENNPQLIFFFLVIRKSTSKQISDIQKIIHGFKRGNPAKIFYVKKEIDPFAGVFPIPNAHHDLIFNRTRVSVINFDEF
ncbi:uncharacterized protein isoform X2 [Leptinotarsa decemlineata]